MSKTSSSKHTGFVVDSNGQVHHRVRDFRNHKAARNFCQSKMKENPVYVKGVVQEPGGQQTTYTL
jgi:hypothetical protein